MHYVLSYTASDDATETTSETFPEADQARARACELLAQGAVELALQDEDGDVIEMHDDLARHCQGGGGGGGGQPTFGGGGGRSTQRAVFRVAILGQGSNRAAIVLVKDFVVGSNTETNRLLVALRPHLQCAIALLGESGRQWRGDQAMAQVMSQIDVRRLNFGTLTITY